MEQLIRQRYTINRQPELKSNRDTTPFERGETFKHKFRHHTLREPSSSNNLPSINNQYEDGFEEIESGRQVNLIDREPMNENDSDIESNASNTDDEINDNNNVYNNNNNNYIRPPASVILNAPTETNILTGQNKRSPPNISSGVTNQKGVILNDRSRSLREPDDHLVTGRIFSKNNQTNRETILPTTPSISSRSAIINNNNYLSQNNNTTSNKQAINTSPNKPQLRNWPQNEAEDEFGESLPNISLSKTLDNRQKQHQTSEQAQEQQQQQLVFIAFGFAVFLLLALTVYKWFHKRRRRDKLLSNSTESGDLLDSLPLFPSNCGKVCAGGNNKTRSTRLTTTTTTRARSKRVDSLDNVVGEENGQVENHGCGKKNKQNYIGLQLVGRVLPNNNAFSEQEEKQICEEKRLDEDSNDDEEEEEEREQEGRRNEEILMQDPSQKTTDSKQLNTNTNHNITHEAQVDHNGNETKSSTMVILKKKIVDHPFMISAKSTAKPRVKLIKASVRKFIDDEAAEMEQKTGNKGKRPTLREALESKLKSLLSVALYQTNNKKVSKSNNNGSGRTVLIENSRLDSMKETDLEEGSKLMKQKEELEMNSLENFLKPTQHHHEASSQILNVEVHATNKSNNEHQQVVGDKRDSSEVIIQEANQPTTTNCLLPNTQNGDNRKLSPFSVDGLNDAYSSLSASSLFSSSSPGEAQQMAQACVCSFPNSYGGFNNSSNNSSNIRSGHRIAMQLFGKELDLTKNLLNHNDNDVLRCKSQGHSPFSPAQINAFNPPRPCCSAIPPPVIPQVAQNELVNGTGTASCCRLPSSYSYHNQQPQQHQQHTLCLQSHHSQQPHEQAQKRFVHNTVNATNNLQNNIQCVQNGAIKHTHNEPFEQQTCSNLVNSRQTASLIHDQSGIVASQYPLNGKKCINHIIQRQYENYYDDEREDVYRRLTASIGMEFGLGFNDDDVDPHHNHHHQHHHLPINAANSAPGTAVGYNFNSPQAENIDNRFSHNHFGIDRYSCFNNGRNQCNSGSVNQMNFAPFIEGPQGCKCCASNKADTLQNGGNINQQILQNHQYSQQFVPTTTTTNFDNSNNNNNSCQYLFRSNGGSAGELLSSTSTSTSFGGSDSGFAPSSNSRQVCHNPICICQSSAMPNAAPQVPMSILVQQPSIGTPPPPISAQQSTPIVEQSPSVAKEAAADIEVMAENQDKSVATTNDGRNVTCAGGDNDKENNQPTSNGETSRGAADEIVVKSQSELAATTATIATFTTAPTKANEISDACAINKQVNEKSQYLLRNDSQQCCKGSLKWKHRRRYSQKTQSDMLGELSQWNLSPFKTPRRMSIAGDHVTQSTYNENAINQAFSNRDALLKDDSSSCVTTLLTGKTTNLYWQHRNSVVSEGGWNSASSPNHARPIQQQFGPNQQQQQQLQQQQAFYNQFKLFGPPYNQHRPSEPSLFDNQHQFGSSNGKSNCSSSGGSSSGIGASGSTCTSTPTSVFPNSSFAATPAKLGTDFFSDFPTVIQGQEKTTMCNYQPQNAQLPQHQQQYQFQQQQQQQQQQHYQQLIQQHSHQCNHFRNQMNGHVDGRATYIWPPSRYNPNELAACPSRKFSLPLQLESKVAERLSPNKARLLFKENLQRDDSANMSSMSSSIQNQARNLPSSDLIGASQVSGPLLDSPSCVASSSNSANTGNRPNGFNRMFDRRMSSQTITRQSSFWLEDNSADSILSLATTSGGVGGMNEPDGSQADVTQSWYLQDTEEKQQQQQQHAPSYDCLTQADRTGDLIQEVSVDQNPQEQGQQQEQEQQQQESAPTRCSNRPSISSLILSADSIESVKQKPITSSAAKDSENLVSELNGGCVERQDSSSDNSTNKTSNKEQSSSNSTLSNTSGGRERRFNGHLKSSFAHMRNRLSSSTSTSSTNSSPSPDFSKPSERILGLASKSSSISKRHMFSKLRSRRYPRLINSTGGAEVASSSGGGGAGRHPALALHQHSAPDSRLTKNESSLSSQEKEETTSGTTKLASSTLGTSKQDIDTTSLTDKSSQSCSQDNDPDVEGLVSAERPISDANSASLERQCRELWKLRAALHDDSCVGDNWSNYHQRLNRRYDSGYKSIENQLSSSIEGNIMAAAAAAAAVNPQTASNAQQTPPPTQTTTGATQQEENLFNRPPSGCSNYISKSTEAAAAAATPIVIKNFDNNGDTADDDANNEDADDINSSKTSSAPTKNPVMLAQTDDSSLDRLEGKLSDLELDIALECLLDEPLSGRECNSRSSKSSSGGEEEKKTGCDTNR